MRITMIGQIVSIAGLCITLAINACAQATATPVPTVPPIIPGVEWLPWVRDLGFPIVAFGAMFWLFRTTVSELAKSFAANTQALNDLKVAVGELRVHCERSDRR